MVVRGANDHNFLIVNILYEQAFYHLAVHCIIYINIIVNIVKAKVLTR